MAGEVFGVVLLCSTLAGQGAFFNLFSRVLFVVVCWGSVYVSRIPFFVAGPQEWNCSFNNGKKTCEMKCTDGFKVGVTASCVDDEVASARALVDAELDKDKLREYAAKF